MSDVFKLSWEGKDYTVNLGEVTANEWRAIKQNCHDADDKPLTVGRLLKALSNFDDLDAEFGVALLWLAKKHAGEDAEFEFDLPFVRLLEGLDIGGDDEADETPKA